VDVEAPLIAPRARKHGIADADMIHAFNYPIVVDTSDGPIIIHAMPARPKYLR
jgi:hypothetical protein